MAKVLYSDKLIEITEDAILIRDYYYPFGSKRVRFDRIERVVVRKPTLLSGKYRYYGTGDFRTWFPPDIRSSREKIFIVIMKKKWWRIGFTVENAQTVMNLLKDTCPLTDESRETS